MEAVPTRDSVLRQFRPGLSETDTRDFIELGSGAAIFAIPTPAKLLGCLQLGHVPGQAEVPASLVA
jgi:hypothetical protein